MPAGSALEPQELSRHARRFDGWIFACVDIVRCSLIFLSLVTLTGCSAGEPADDDRVTAAVVDIKAAAAEAQGDIDTYAANVLEPALPVAGGSARSGTARPPVATARRVPAPAKVAAEAPPGPDELRYRCAGRTRISVRMDGDGSAAIISDGDRDVAVAGTRSATSGIWYKGGGYELRGDRDRVDYTAPDRAPVACSTESYRAGTRASSSGS